MPQNFIIKSLHVLIMVADNKWLNDTTEAVGDNQRTKRLVHSPVHLDRQTLDANYSISNFTKCRLSY